MTIVWNLIKAFLVGGALCMIGEILLLKTKLTPARILVGYIVAGVFLSAIGVYAPLAQFAGAGASVPLTGFGHAPEALPLDSARENETGRSPLP